MNRRRLPRGAACENARFFRVGSGKAGQGSVGSACAAKPADEPDFASLGKRFTSISRVVGASGWWTPTPLASALLPFRVPYSGWLGRQCRRCVRTGALNGCKPVAGQGVTAVPADGLFVARRLVTGHRATAAAGVIVRLRVGVGRQGCPGRGMSARAADVDAATVNRRRGMRRSWQSPPVCSATVTVTVTGAVLRLRRNWPWLPVKAATR